MSGNKKFHPFGIFYRLKLFISAKNDALVVIFDYKLGVGTPDTPIRMEGNCKIYILQLPKNILN